MEISMSVYLAVPRDDFGYLKLTHVYNLYNRHVFTNNKLEQEFRNSEARLQAIWIV